MSYLFVRDYSFSWYELVNSSTIECTEFKFFRSNARFIDGSSELSERWMVKKELKIDNKWKYTYSISM